MINFKDTKDKSLTNKLISLYIESFPYNERRDTNYLLELAESSDAMHFTSINDDDILCGLLIYWNFKDFYYIEHFAIFPEMRNKKLGERTLSLFKDKFLPCSILLEAEPPLDEISIRRIRFYEKNGFTVLDKEYIQPPYSETGISLPLWILGITQEPSKTKEYIETIKQHVYRNHY